MDILMYFEYCIMFLFKNQIYKNKFIIWLSFTFIKNCNNFANYDFRKHKTTSSRTFGCAITF